MNKNGIIKRDGKYYIQCGNREIEINYIKLEKKECQKKPLTWLHGQSQSL